MSTDRRLRAEGTIVGRVARLQHMAASVNASVRVYESGTVRITWSRYAATHVQTYEQAVEELEREAARLVALGRLARQEDP